MNLIVGATGKLGFEICKLLASESRPVRAMVRDPFNQERAKQLRNKGVQLVQGDLRHKKTFGPVLKGVTHVIATASAMSASYIPEENDIHLVDKNGMMDLVDAAWDAGVQHYIYISFSGNISEDFPLRNAKRTVEIHLRNTGMTFTVLRPGFFMEYWLNSAMGFDVANSSIQIYGTGKEPVSYVSYRDVALFAIKSLYNPIARNLIIELGGPDKYSQLAAAALFENVHGRKFNYENFPEKSLREQMHSSLDPMERSMFGLKLALAQGDPIDMKDTMKAFHFRLRSLEEFARASFPHSKSGIANSR